MARKRAPLIGSDPLGSPNRSYSQSCSHATVSVAVSQTQTPRPPASVASRTRSLLAAIKLAVASASSRRACSRTTASRAASTSRTAVMSCIDTTAPSFRPSSSYSGRPLATTVRTGPLTGAITIRESLTSSPASARASGISGSGNRVRPSSRNKL